MKVVSVVVTYNRCASLRQCLQGIRAQTLAPMHVIVIDNASTDGTSRMLAEEFPDVEIRRLPENTGCTGGLHAAFLAALAHAPHFIWFFDDDAIAEPGCLDALVRAMQRFGPSRRVGILRPMVRDETSGDMSGASLSHGALLRADMVASVPLPPAELFMEYDDKIYGKLAREAGYEIIRHPEYLIRHPVRRAQTSREILTRGYRVNTWRLYYGVRNRIYYNVYMKPSFLRALSSIGIGVRSVVLLTLFGRPRRGQVLVLRGIVDGLLGRLGRRVSPAY